MEFPPLHPGLPAIFWVAMIIALAAGGGTVWLLAGRHGLKGSMWRQVVPLWGFILCLMAVGTMLYSWLEQRQTGTVRVDATGVETPFGKVDYGDVRRVYIHQDVDKSLIDPSVGRDTANWLIIEERNGKKHFLPADEYDLPAIMKTMEGFREENRSGK